MDDRKITLRLDSEMFKLETISNLADKMFWKNLHIYEDGLKSFRPSLR